MSLLSESCRVTGIQEKLPVAVIDRKPNHAAIRWRTNKNQGTYLYFFMFFFIFMNDEITNEVTDLFVLAD